jgi:hypothetical protein
MGRTSALFAGLIAGVILSGLAVAALLPQLPAPWRSERLVWISATTLVALCVGIAWLASRRSRE